MIAKARAHANIALVKYWGKRDEILALPNNSSLSLTLDKLYTETEVEFKEDLMHDEFYLNGVKDDVTLIKVSKFLDLFRNASHMNYKAIVKSVNYVPTAAGLASSASAFAALGAAANVASGLNLDDQELSTFVRKGSGSATRSIYGGFVEWRMGSDDASSHAVKIDDADWDVGMVIVLVNGEKKEISSREGMKSTVLTSPFYKEWPDIANADLLLMKDAIKNKDIKMMGEVAESNALKMHATMMTSNPSILYFEPKTILAIQHVKKLRAQGLDAYFTMDAGPNVKILCRLSQASLIKETLLEHFSDDDIMISGVGSGIQIIKE